MSPEPKSTEPNPFLCQLSYYGIILGLVIIFFQMEPIGLLSPTRGFVLNDNILALLIIGFLLTLFSFICLRWFQYGRLCLVDPEFIKDLWGNSSPSVKILIITIIGFNALGILVLFLLLPVALKNPNHDSTMLYIILLLWGGIDAILWFMYRTMKAREKGESVSPINYSKILLYGIGLAGFVIIFGLEWYYPLIPDSEKTVFMIGQLLVLAVIIYASYVIRQSMQTGNLLFVPKELEKHLNTTRLRYGGLIKIAIILNAIVLLMFALIADHHIPLNLGIWYWIWLGGILWVVNTMIVIMAMLMYPDASD
jgi:hypothetical protein